MRVFRTFQHGPITGVAVGRMPVGRPFITVYFYRLGSSLYIDSGIRNMRKTVVNCAASHPPKHVLLTHHHEDHTGNAGVFSALFGACVWGDPYTRKKMARRFPIYPYQHLMLGKADPVDVRPVPEVFHHEGYRLISIPTPGHSPDHRVYLEPDHGWLFSGDLYLGDRIRYFRRDERLDEQIRSLKKVLKLNFETLFCAHHPVLKNGPARIAAKLQYLEDFYGSVRDVHDKGIVVPADIMAQLRLKESRLVKWMTQGNVSMENMVSSALR